MPVETFDPTPFEVLAALVADPSARNVRVPQSVSKSCFKEFDKFGKALNEFVTNIPNDSPLFQFLANALRAAKGPKLRLQTGAHLFTEIGWIKNVIKRICTCSAADRDYETFLSFWKALKDGPEGRRAAA